MRIWVGYLGVVVRCEYGWLTDLPFAVRVQYWEFAVAGRVSDKMMMIVIMMLLILLQLKLQQPCLLVI